MQVILIMTMQITACHLEMLVVSGRLRIDSTGFVQGNINSPAWFGSQDTQHNVATGTWVALLNLGNSVINPSINNGGWNESTGTFYSHRQVRQGITIVLVVQVSMMYRTLILFIVD